MAELEPGAKVAKDLGIYLGQLYGWVKAGKVKNHKEDGKYVVEGGKGLIVDPEEARSVWMASSKKTRAPRAAGSSRSSKPKATRGSGAEAEETGRKATRVPAGALVSYERGRHKDLLTAGAPRYTIGQVLGQSGRLTYIDDGDHRRHYTGAQIDNTVFFNDRLSTMLARGVARIEHPNAVLGMLILSYIMDEKVEIAQSLEDWMIEQGIEVHIPELVEVEDEQESDPVRGQPTMIAQEADDE